MANENADQRIFQQIEQSANFYQPAVYELLSFYQALENQEEPLDGQFIPLTTVQARSSQQTKIFAVGLLPPSSTVTGRLLDRSASVQVLATSATADLPEFTPSPDKFDFIVRPNAGLVQQGSLSGHFHETRHLQAGGTKEHQGIDIAAPLGAEVRAAADGVVVSITADGIRSGYGNTIIIKHADGTSSLYAHLQDFGGGTAIGDHLAGGTVIGHIGQTSNPVPPPGPHLHFEVLTSLPSGAPANKDGIAVNRQEPQRIDPQRWLAQQGRTIASAKGAADPPVQAAFSGDADVAANWHDVGTNNASKASQTASQMASKTLNATNLGKEFLAQQQATIKMMREALDQMAKTPPLRLLVNPQSFRTSAEKIISDGNWGRNGPIIEHWGENQDKVEGSGKIAAFYSLDAYNANGPGLSRTARQFSVSYQNLLALWLIYKNNGGVWFPDPIVPTGSRAKNLAVVGSVYLYYDEILYIGSFDSFTLTESETGPFTLEYSFSFTVRAWYLLDHLDDTQYTYGRPTTTTLPTGTPATNPLMGGNNAQVSPNVALPPDAHELVGR
jgi:murein DD-endopeptidase MepM/ murein hydrolase activator NlpD